jgi:PleD family two-component response regulator
MVKVLLLEDDSNYREIIERVIRRNDSYAITSVATERQAWEELSRETFDLVLLDLNIDGRRCWETLKRAVRHPGKPVAIVFSCEDTRRNAEYAVSHGAYTFLSKPFNFSRLKATLDAALRAKHRGMPGTPEGGDVPPIVAPEGIAAPSGNAEPFGRPEFAPSPDPGAPTAVVGRERENSARNGRQCGMEQGVFKEFRNGKGGAGRPACFRIRLREEFERSLRYKRDLTLILLALDDPEAPEKPLFAPHGGPAHRYVQDVIRSALRRTDLFAPFGNNEFSVLMPETRSDRVLPRISGLREKLQADLAAGREEAPGNTVWVGMASIPAGSSAGSGIRRVHSPDDFLRMARLALYRARLDETSPVAIFGA